MKTFGNSATIIGTVALILCIVGVANPYWEQSKVFGFGENSGLWDICWSWGGIDDKTYTNDYRLNTGPMKAVKALEILGKILLGFSLVSAVLKLTVKKDLLILFMLSGGLALFSGILMITGTVMYATKTINGIKYLHAGFGLCVTSGFLSIISGALYFFAGKRELIKLRQKSDLYHVAHM